MYPMILGGVLKEKIWGGSHLSEFGKDIKDKKIGESWEVSCHSNGVSRVQNGRFKGLSLCDLLGLEEEKVFNEKMTKFPLLIKYIDANDNLSLQVHPDDEYCHNINEPFGKTEAWYIISAEEGAEIILGSLDKTQNDLEKHIADFTEIDYTNHIKVHAGELYFVPSGTLHAIGKGIVILEIQQNSDTTYRVFDYFRNRELHIKEAKEVVKLTTTSKKCKGKIQKNEDYIITKFIDVPEFTIEKIKTINEYREVNSEHDFQLINCIEGQGYIIHEEGYTKIFKGISLLIPARMGTYKIIGQNTVIRTYISKKN